MWKKRLMLLSNGQVEYIQDFFDSISSFFLGDSAQQAEREDDEDGEEYDYEDGDDDYR